MVPLINEFRGEYGIFSNFHRASIMHAGLQFPSSEHFFQCYKHNDKVDLFYKIKGHPFKGLKALARSKPCRPDWDQVRDSVMRQALLYKFTQHSNLAKNLLATDGTILVEGNYWHDNYWGDCMCQNSSGKHPECLRPGKNRLGFLLMYIRETLKFNS